MATIVTRAVKGSALTHTEMDANFNNLNNDKPDVIGTPITNNVATFDASDDVQDGGYSFTNAAGAITPTHTELNYVDGVTSAIQTQLDLKAPLASPTLTGVPLSPTATLDTDTTQIATTAFVLAQIKGMSAVAGDVKNGGNLKEYSGAHNYSSTLQYSFIVPKDGEYRLTCTQRWNTASGGGESFTVTVKRDGGTVTSWSKTASSTSTQNNSTDVSGWTAGNELQVFVSSSGSSTNTWYLDTFYIKESDVTATSSLIYDLDW